MPFAFLPESLFTSPEYPLCSTDTYCQRYSHVEVAVSLNNSHYREVPESDRRPSCVDYSANTAGIPRFPILRLDQQPCRVRCTKLAVPIRAIPARILRDP